MASTQLSDFSAALSLMYRRRLTTQINSLVVLLFLLPVLPGEGKACYWTAEFSGASDAAASAEGVARSSSDADDEIEVGATLAWAQYDKTASVTDLAQFAAGSNFNPESVGAFGADLLGGKVQRQIRRLALGMGSDLYSGNPGASPVELAGAALAIDSSGTFAGIDPTTYSEWAAAENSIATANLSFQAVRENLITPVYDACGEIPEFLTCPSDVFDKLKALFNDNELHVEREVVLARGGGLMGNEPRTVKLRAGMDCIFIDGIPVIRDRHCTASTIYAWNTNYVAVRQLSPMWSILQQGTQAIQEVFRRLADDPKLVLPREQLEGMAARNNGIMPYVKLLGDRGLSTEAVVAAHAQVEYLRRNGLGKLTLT